LNAAFNLYFPMFFNAVVLSGSCV